MKSTGEVARILLNHVAEGTTDSAKSVMTIPSTSYTDEAVWQEEMETIFLRLPILAGVTAEIPEPGDFKTFDCLERPVLIVRQADGSLRAMLNVCTHRSMLVALEDRGNANRFSCSYHGWTFRRDGSLAGIADKSKFGHIDRNCLGLTQLPVFERAGLIFVILTPDVIFDFEEFFGDALIDIEKLHMEDRHFCGTRKIAGANWKIAFDGYLEGYHFAAAHPQTIHPRTYSNVMHFDAAGPHLRIGFPQRGINDLLRGKSDAELEECENSGLDYVRTLFPNTSVFVAPEIIQISQILPGPGHDANRTIMYFLSKKPPENEEDRKANEAMMDFLRDVVEEEDFELGLAVQRGILSGANDVVRFGKNERGNQYFHKWVAHYMQGDSASEKPAL